MQRSTGGGNVLTPYRTVLLMLKHSAPAGSAPKVVVFTAALEKYAEKIGVLHTMNFQSAGIWFGQHKTGAGGIALSVCTGPCWELSWKGGYQWIWRSSQISHGRGVHASCRGQWVLGSLRCSSSPDLHKDWGRVLSKEAAEILHSDGVDAQEWVSECQASTQREVTCSSSCIGECWWRKCMGQSTTDMGKEQWWRRRKERKRWERCSPAPLAIWIDVCYRTWRWGDMFQVCQGPCGEPCGDGRVHACQFCLGQHPNKACPKKGGKQNKWDVEDTGEADSFSDAWEEEASHRFACENLVDENDAGEEAGIHANEQGATTDGNVREFVFVEFFAGVATLTRTISELCRGFVKVADTAVSDSDEGWKICVDHGHFAPPCRTSQKLGGLTVMELSRCWGRMHVLKVLVMQK